MEQKSRARRGGAKYTPPKLNIDIKNDALEHVSSASNLALLGIYVKFQGIFTPTYALNLDRRAEHPDHSNLVNHLMPSKLESNFILIEVDAVFFF